MSGTERTFHTTKEDIRKQESKLGNPSKDSDVSQMKSIIDQQTDKNAEIEQRKANLPLPEQPPVASDLKSAQQDTVNVGSGRFSGDVSGGAGGSSLREPATAESSARVQGDEWKKPTAPGGNVGRQMKEGLQDLPKDATAR